MKFGVVRVRSVYQPEAGRFTPNVVVFEFEIWVCGNDLSCTKPSLTVMIVLKSTQMVLVGWRIDFTVQEVRCMPPRSHNKYFSKTLLAFPWQYITVDRTYSLRTLNVFDFYSASVTMPLNLKNRRKSRRGVVDLAS